MNSENNTHKKTTLEKPISEKENSIPKVHSESYFSQQLFEALYILKKQKLRNNDIVEVEKPTVLALKMVTTQGRQGDKNYPSYFLQTNTRTNHRN
ncbi:MAG: hypothetical protein AAGE84_27230, partial [Cyanobacteria bacterium P01_G01_bin.39]